MIEIPSLHQAVTITLDVGCDGPSLPILMVTILERVGKKGSRRTYVMFNQDQANELTRQLQSLITEM